MVFAALDNTQLHAFDVCFDQFTAVEIQRVDRRHSDRSAFEFRAVAFQFERSEILGFRVVDRWDTGNAFLLAQGLVLCINVQDAVEGEVRAKDSEDHGLSFECVDLSTFADHQ